MKTLPVNKIIPFSSVDGDGNRMAIFLQGCNFNCLNCHNPETINLCDHCGDCVSVCESQALSFVNESVRWDQSRCISCDQCINICPSDASPKITTKSIADILQEIVKVQHFIRGITLSGGECTLYAENLTILFKAVKKLGLTTYIDTNGFIDFRTLPKLVEYMDKAMVDLKSVDDAEHLMLTAKSNKSVLENIQYLGGINKLYEVRTVVVPKLLDNIRNITIASHLIASVDPKIRYKLIKYRPAGVRLAKMDSEVPDDNLMLELKSIANSNGLSNVVIV